MNFKKIFVILSALVMVIGISTNTVKAIDFQNSNMVISNANVKPLWNNTSSIFVDLYSSGRILNAETLIKPYSSNADVSGTLYLERLSNGRWITESSWTISGTGSVSISRSYSGTRGNTYRTRVSANVNGERASSTSRSVSL